MRHQLTVVFLQMGEYTRHGVIYQVHSPIGGISQVSSLDRANNVLDKRFLHSSNLTEQAHFLVVHNPHIGFHVDGCAVWNVERMHYALL